MANEENNDDRLKKIFVGGLNRSTKNDGLKAYFETYGDMSDCVVITDSQTKESRGFGYVTFENKESVIEVLKDKKEKGAHTIDGKEVEVKRAIPKDDDSATARLKTKKIFIGGLKDEATADDIQQSLITAVRGITPTSVDLIMKKQDDGGPSKHRGFCFVEFEDEDIVDELCCLKKVNICGKMVEVKKAEPKDKDSRGQGGRGGRGGGRGGPGGGRGRGRGGDQGGHHYGGYPGSGYNQYGGYGGGDSSYYGSGYEVGYDYYGMGAYQQAPSGYGPQGGYGRGAGGERYRPY